MKSLPAIRRSLAMASVAVACILPATAPAAAAATANDARAACTIRGQQTTFGPSYLTRLAVSGGATCANGKSVVRAYDACRKRNGGNAGRCPSKVLSYSCSETRTSGRFQFSASATCRNGAKVVTFAYTQNL